MKNQVFILLATTLAASTPMLDASISGVKRETEMNGDIVITAAQTTNGKIIAQVSDDGGLNWSQPTLLNENLPNCIFPVVAVGASAAACVFLANLYSIPQAIVVGGTVTGHSGAWGGPSGTWGITEVSNRPSYATPQGLDFAGTGNDVLLFLNSPSELNPDFIALFNFVTPISFGVFPVGGELDISVSSNTTTIMPVLFAANGLTALAIAPQSEPDNDTGTFFGLSYLCKSNLLPKDHWITRPAEKIISLDHVNPLLPPASQIQLATSEGISQASLVWLGADSLLYTSELNPIIDAATATVPPLWSTPVSLSMDLTSIGGLNFDEASNTLQVLAYNNRGQLIHATGTSDAITHATRVGGTSINQISNSQINGATGLWLVLDKSQTLSLWQASPQGLTSMTIAQKLTSVQDHNTSLSIASDKSTGVVLLVFDIASASAQFPGHPDLAGPGTYLFRSEGYPLDFTAQRIAN